MHREGLMGGNRGSVAALGTSLCVGGVECVGVGIGGLRG